MINFTYHRPLVTSGILNFLNIFKYTNLSLEDNTLGNLENLENLESLGNLDNLGNLENLENHEH